MEIEPTKRYSPRAIALNGWIVNSRNKPSHIFVLKEIKAGRLKTIPVPPLYKKNVVTGAEIIRYRIENGLQIS